MNEREREQIEGYQERQKFTDEYIAGGYREAPDNPVSGYTDLRDKSADELEDDIELIRKQMDRTLSDLEMKLSPGQLIDRSLHYLQRGPGEYMSNLGQSVKSQPLPIALVGIGLSWLIYSDRKQTAGESHLRRSGETREKMEEVRGKASETAQRAKQKMEGVSQAVSDRMHRMSERAHSTKESASEWGHRIGEVRHRSGERLQRAGSNFSHAVENQPLILGVLGVAAGALLGALLPPTRQEDVMLGPAKERMKEQAAETGREQLAKGQAIASAAAQSAKEEAERQLH